MTPLYRPVSTNRMILTFPLLLILLVTTSQAALDCPEGWTVLGDSCYKVMEEYQQTNRFDWIKALRLCLGFGGNLFSSENENEVAFVNGLISPLKNASVWIGLTYLFQEGGYLWSDGTPYNSSLYNKWLLDMPLDNNSEIYCGEFLKTGWNLTTCCKENKHFICKKPKGPLPCPAGWFLNGLSCYKTSDKLRTWKEAHQECKTAESYLVKTNDKTEQRFLLLYMDIVGLQDENNPVWIDQKTNDKCVQVNTVDGHTEDQNCDRRRTYVCEKPVPDYFCYQHPSNTSFSGYTVNCTFPENVCFKYSQKAEQVTVQGCTSAEHCKRNEMKYLECCKGDRCNKEISCYQCSSNISFDDCIKSQVKVDCPIPVQYCAKTERKGASKVGKAETTFHKECSTSDHCQQTNTRTVECCNHSLCNIDSGIRCYDCVGAVNFEDCSKIRCAFNGSVCYRAWKQQSSSGARDFKYGCTKQDFCNKTDEDGYFRQCCKGILCNKENKPPQGDPSSLDITAYIALGVGFCLVLFISVLIGFLWYRKVHHKQKKRASSLRREIIPLDKWEILPEEIEYEEELGRGAFGVVYKATLKRRVGIEVFYTGSRVRLDPKKASQVVAVKVLKDDSNEMQKESFMLEIKQMKQLGFHQNIVSLVGCCTFHEPKFLVIEYVPFGDLLQWLRHGRRMINQNETPEENNTGKSYDDKQVLEGQGETGELFLETREQVEEDETQEKRESVPIHRDVIVDMTLSSENPSEGCEEPVDQALPSVPTTSEGNNGAASMVLSTENHEKTDDEHSDSFTTKQLFSFAWQIARGMNHLAEKNLVHRDLAARNVLVGENNKVKISDFGLMREVYEDVYTTEKTKTLPVKWMAPESIYQSIFTIKSDVWSYGVLLWEMATLGGVPYPLLTNSELYKLLKTGYRMERPEMCCDEIHQLMSECWREDPSTRPSFSQLIEKLEVIMQMDVLYFDPSKYDETSPYYNVPGGESAVEEETTF